jgi:hypothetical protein
MKNSIVIEIAFCKECLYAHKWYQYDSGKPYRCDHPFAPHPLNDERSEVPSYGVPDWCPHRDIKAAAALKERNDLIRRRGELSHKEGKLRSNIERNCAKIAALLKQNEKMEKECNRVQRERTDVLIELDKNARGE